MHSWDNMRDHIWHIKFKNNLLTMWMIWDATHGATILEYFLLGSNRGYLGVVRVYYSLEFPIVGVHKFLGWFTCIPNHHNLIGRLICSVLFFLVELSWCGFAYTLIIPWVSRGSNFRYPILHTWRRGWKLLNLYVYWTWLNLSSWLALFLYNQWYFHLQ